MKSCFSQSIYTEVLLLTSKNISFPLKPLSMQFFSELLENTGPHLHPKNNCILNSKNPFEIQEADNPRQFDCVSVDL